MKQIFAGSVMALMLSMGASAAPLADCMAVTTLQDLINDNAVGGCQHQDKIFSNFAYNGTGAQAANLVNATHEFTASPTGTTDVHGWLFQLPGTWITGFTLSYDITVAPGFPNEKIFASKDQEQSGLTPNGTSIIDTESVGMLHINGSATGETSLITYAPVNTVHTSSVYTPNGGGLVTYEQDFFQTAVPEPATVAMCGGALLLLGWVNKKRHSV